MMPDPAARCQAPPYSAASLAEWIPSATAGYLQEGRSTMEAQWLADRTTLRTLLRTQPRWTWRDLAEAIGRSLSWVKKWIKRLRTAAPDDPALLQSRSRARKQPPTPISQVVVERILAIRDAPPGSLRRVPGPRTIRYYLEQDQELRAQGVALPRSTRTIWRILHQHGRIPHQTEQAHVPVERPDPLTSWQLDFKDVSTVPADPEGKQAHVVEVLDVVDVGTSLLLDAQVREDFTAETALAAASQTVCTYGLPSRVTFDRDPRFVGSQHQRDFPSPFIRFWLCLGVQVTVCPPRRPDLNAFVERFHRTLEYECLRLDRPADVDQARAATAAFARHYNEERPHQGCSCRNLPPRIAFPFLPALPPVPAWVDPDRWVDLLDGQTFARKVLRDTCVKVDEVHYYINQQLVGQYVTLRVDAAQRVFVVEHAGAVVKQVPIKGLVGEHLPFATYVTYLCEEARSERLRRPRVGVQLSLW
jgi:transposase InsO family protein